MAQPLEAPRKSVGAGLVIAVIEGDYGHLGQVAGDRQWSTRCSKSEHTNEDMKHIFRDLKAHFTSTEVEI